jgi:hypothetical protein
MKIENPDNFFSETPLYEKFDVKSQDPSTLFDIVFFTGKIDCFCPFCERDSTFIGTNKSP